MSLKETIRVHLNLISPRRAFAYGIVSILGIRTVLPLEELTNHLEFVAATFFVFAFLWCGTNYYNHIHDIKADSINDPARPLPSRRITAGRVRSFVFLWYGLSFSIILLILRNPIVFICAALYVLLAYLYSSPRYKLKHRAWGSIFTITSAIFLSLIGGVAIFKDDLAQILTISSGYGLLWVGILIMTAIGAAFSKEFKDIEGDVQAGSKTYPILWGVEKAAKASAFFLVVPHMVAILSYFQYPMYLQIFLYSEVLILLYVLYAIKRFLDKPRDKSMAKLYWIRATNASIGICLAYILGFVNP